MAATTQTSTVGRHGSARNPRRSRRAPVQGRLRVVAEVTALLLIAVLLVAIPILSRQSGDVRVEDTSEVILGQGDTLWSLAESHPVKGFTTAEVVDLIASLNGITTAAIPVGSTIEVPDDVEAVALAFK